MSSAKVIALTKVINGLKDSHPDLNYQLLPQLNIKLDSTCIDKSDDIKDLREAVKFLKFPILEPIKEVISKMIDEKKKLTTSSPRLEKLMKLLETDNEMEIDSETSTSSTKKQKKQNVVDKPCKKIKITDPSDMIASQESSLIFNNTVKWWRPFNILCDGRYDPLCFDGKECKKETNQWNHEKEVACKQLMKEKCCFRMNIIAFLKLVDKMKELNANFWPIPKCSCTKEKLISKNKIAVRGSSPKAEKFQLWYYCEDCRTTFYFTDYDKKIKKVLNSQPQLIQEEEVDSDDEPSNATHEEEDSEED